MFSEEFSYIPDASFSEYALFLPALVSDFSDTPDASQILMSFTYTLRCTHLFSNAEFNGEFLLHSGC